MAVNNGAEQFSAFAALTGFDDIIREHERITESRREISEEAVYELSEKLSRIAKGSRINVVFYCTNSFFIFTFHKVIVAENGKKIWIKV